MIEIKPMSIEHAAAVLEIYQQGIDTGSATFETEAPTWEKFDQKFLPHSRLVALKNSKPVGWAVLSAASQRPCYSGVGEVTIYVDLNETGQGIGKALMEELILESEKNGIWSLLSVIHEENAISIRLHEKTGFRIIGFRERIAKLNGKWKTTVMMERRSKLVGIN